MLGQEESAADLMDCAFEPISPTIAVWICVLAAATCRVRRLASSCVKVDMFDRRLSEVRNNQVPTHDYLCDSRARHVRSLKES